MPLKTQDKPVCCGKCDKATDGTCTKLNRMLATLKPPPKESNHAV